MSWNLNGLAAHGFIKNCRNCQRMVFATIRTNFLQQKFLNLELSTLVLQTKGSRTYFYSKNHLHHLKHIEESRNRVEQLNKFVIKYLDRKPLLFGKIHISLKMICYRMHWGNISSWEICEFFQITKVSCLDIL